MSELGTRINMFLQKVGNFYRTTRCYTTEDGFFAVTAMENLIEAIHRKTGDSQGKK
jgi:hypothetical protein